MDGHVLGHDASILIDCGAQARVISDSFVKRHRLKTIPLTQTITTKFSNRMTLNLSRMTNVEWSITDNAGRVYRERENFLVAPIPFDLILGKSWLRKENPQIDWRENSVQFDDFAFTAQPTTRRTAFDLQTLQISAMQVKKAAKQKGQRFYLCVLKDYIEAIDDVREGTTSTSEGVCFSQTTDDNAVRRYVDTLLRTQFKDSLCSEEPPHHPRFPESRGELDHRIDLVPGTKPPVGVTYHMSRKELETLRTTLEDLLRARFIRPSNSPYGCPVLFIPKKGTSELRFCVDYRAINKLTVADRYPLPRIDELLDQLADARQFSKIDLRSGYWQIRIREQDISKTAFRTKYGSFEWVVMPFGLCNAPATFQRLMNQVLRPYIDKFVCVYLDDLLIYSKTVEEHKEHIRLVMEALQNAKLQINTRKCDWGMKKISYLGFIVTPNGLQPDPQKVAAVKDWPIPRTQRDVRAFLGLAGYFRRFIDQFAAKTIALTDLTQEGVDVRKEWSKRHEQEMDWIKDALMNAPVLKLPDFNRHFHVLPDYCGNAVGAWIGQSDPPADESDIRSLRPIAYLSRKLNKHERNYPTFEGELLAIVNALQEWRPYLEGSSFTIHSDHRGLQWLMSQKSLNRRQARWVEVLQGYEAAVITGNTATPKMTIKYLPGDQNTVGDLLSRRHDHGEEVETINVNAISFAVNDLEQDILQCLVRDPLLREIRAATDTDGNHPPRIQRYLRKWYKDEQGLLRTKLNDRVIVPNDRHLRKRLLYEFHDSPTAGHRGIEATLATLSKFFYWRRMDSTIREYVTTCDRCLRTKATAHRPYGLLTPVETPSRKWDACNMDFVVQLPKTKRGHDALMVVIDRLSKLVVLIPTTTDATAAQTAQLFFDNVFRQHGLPRAIVSDRDSKFTSKFWNALHNLCGTKLSMSTAYHPQSDGLVERANRTVEEALRIYVNHRQDNWDECLTAIEFALNNAPQKSTGYSPFELTYGQAPLVPGLLLNKRPADSNAPAANDFIDKMKALSQLAHRTVIAAQERQKAYADKRRQELVFNVGDKVFLNADRVDNIVTKNRPSRKLNDKRIGPYAIIAKVGSVAYRLRLPKNIRVHPVFHVSQLEPAPKKDSFNRIVDPPPPIEVGDHDEYEVEEILNHRRRRGKLEFLVKWNGYPTDDATWEPRSHLANAHELIDDYLQLNVYEA
jgi:transposase InsO family protein